MNISIKLAVFFDGIFWVGIFERVFEEQYQVSRVVFGAEPKDYEVYAFILENFYNLSFSNPLSNDEFEIRSINPKRLQRQIKRETEHSGVGTKAQLAMKQQYEANKVERTQNSREKRLQEKQMQFELRQEKKKEKHRGH